MPIKPGPIAPPPDLIYHHEDWQPVSLGRFIGERWAAIKLRNDSMPDIPDADSPADFVDAHINHGRWMAECPAGCGHAIVAGRPPDGGDNTLYICLSPPLMCPAAKVWYVVRYPRLKRAIERVLMKRPTKRPFYASHRNWFVGETVPELKKQNEEMGVPV